MSITVAFFLHHLESGGLERVVLNLLRHLDRARFRPVLILQHRRGTLLARVPDDVAVLDTGGRRNLLAAGALARRLDECGADVAHSGTRSTNFALVRAAGRTQRRPAVVLAEHTPIEASLAESGWRAVYVAFMRRTYPRAERVVVPNPLLGDELREVLGEPDLAVEALANPVYAASALEGPRDEREPDTLVAAGRMVPAKRFDLLLRAFALVGRGRLSLLGDGPERAGLEALASELGVADRVRFTGVVDDPYAHFRRARAVVLSSEREGFPSVLVEAMACGAPVVSVDCPFGPRVLLDDGRAGLLVESRDPEELAAAMRRILEDDDLAAELAQRGRERAQAYEIGRAVPAYEELFAEVASRRR